MIYSVRKSPFLLTLLFTAVFFGFSYIAIYAEESNVNPAGSNSERAVPVTDSIKDKNSSEQERAQRKTNLIDKAKNKGLIMLTRYESAIRRFESIIARIETRVVTAKQDGKDVSQIESAIADVKAEIQESKDSIQAAKVTIEALGENTQDAALKSITRNIIDTLKKEKLQLIEMHKSLKSIVTLLKTLAPGQNKEDSAPKL